MIFESINMDFILHLCICVYYLCVCVNIYYYSASYKFRNISRSIRNINGIMTRKNVVKRTRPTVEYHVNNWKY